MGVTGMATDTTPDNKAILHDLRGEFVECLDCRLCVDFGSLHSGWEYVIEDWTGRCHLCGDRMSDHDLEAATVAREEQRWA